MTNAKRPLPDCLEAGLSGNVDRATWHVCLRTSSSACSSIRSRAPTKTSDLERIMLSTNVDRQLSSTPSTMEPVDPSPLELEPRQLPRWAQVIAGIVLAPIALLCVPGAGTIFTLPKVRGSPPLLLLAAAILLGTLWVVAVCVRLVLGVKRDVGLLGPHAMRIIAIGALGLVASGLFTGYSLQHPAVGGLLAISYVATARRLFALAKTRSTEAINTSSRPTRSAADWRPDPKRSLPSNS
jgi:hypothetical protein